MDVQMFICAFFEPHAASTVNMRLINMSSMQIVHKGNRWQQQCDPCSKNMIKFLERDESIVSWLQPCSGTIKDQIPAIMLDEGAFCTLSLRMMKAVWRHIRLKKGFVNMEPLSHGGFKLKIPHLLLQEKIRTQTRFNIMRHRSSSSRVQVEDGMSDGDSEAPQCTKNAECEQSNIIGDKQGCSSTSNITCNVNGSDNGGKSAVQRAPVPRSRGNLSCKAPYSLHGSNHLSSKMARETLRNLLSSMGDQIDGLPLRTEISVSPVDEIVAKLKYMRNTSKDKIQSIGRDAVMKCADAVLSVP